MKVLVLWFTVTNWKNLRVNMLHDLLTGNRSIRLQLFMKIGVLKNFAIYTRKHLSF